MYVCSAQIENKANVRVWLGGGGACLLPLRAKIYKDHYLLNLNRHTYVALLHKMVMYPDRVYCQSMLVTTFTCSIFLYYIVVFIVFDVHTHEIHISLLLRPHSTFSKGRNQSKKILPRFIWYSGAAPLVSSSLTYHASHARLSSWCADSLIS